MNELDINNPQLPDFIVPGADEKKQDEPAKIKVIGVGGGGGNAVNHMYHQGIGGVSFVLCNTDAQALRNSPVPVKVQLGAKGEGAGNIPEVAKKLAEESASEVEALFDDNTRMAFITAGMGGGTGTGAAPVVARIAKEKGVLTVGIVTIPFLFEGEPKILQAFAGVEEMRKHVDALLVINNERLCKIYPDLSWTTAFAKADDSLSNAARSIAELVSKDGKINLLDLNRQQMREFFKDLGEKPFRADQVMKWMYHYCCDNFDEMTDINKVLRGKLKEVAEIRAPEVVEEQRSSDGTIKWAIAVGDQRVETVYIPEDDRATLCVSSQVGCALECKFCSTAQQGFNRNLRGSDIIGQVWRAAKIVGAVKTTGVRPITNVVMMGMGEPLLNLNNVVPAMEIMLDDFGFGLSKRRVTLSTSGVVPALDKLGDMIDVALAISLHAPNDEIRDEIVPDRKSVV